MKSFIALSILLLCVFQVNTHELKFLDDKVNPGQVIIKENCSETAEFQNLRTKVTPDTITKGGVMNIKVMGKSSKNEEIDYLQISCKLNGKDAYSDKKSLKQKANAGQSFIYEYDQSVPTFIPEGKFEVYLYLVNTNGETVSCLNAYFEF